MADGAMRHVTLKQLRLLAAVARGGSFAAAAEACNVTAPAVTMQMQALEADIGLPLFERHGRVLNLTDAGREVIACAKAIDGALADCSAGLAQLAAVKSGRVTVGVVSTAKYFAPAMLAAFARNHPGVELELVIGNREETTSAFIAGRFDVAVTGRPPEGVEAESVLIGDHPYVAIAAPDHRLARKRAITSDLLAAETFFMREAGSGTRMLTERVFARNRIAPKIGMEISSNETIKQAVIAGLGIALISAHTIAAEVEDGRLVILDVTGLPEMRQWFVVRPAAKRLMPAAAALRDFLVSDGHAYLPRHAMPRASRPAPAVAAAVSKPLAKGAPVAKAAAQRTRVSVRKRAPAKA